MKKNIFSAPAVFSLPGFWRENSSLLALGALVVLAVVIFIWLLLRRRHDPFPEIKLAAQSSELEKGMTQIEIEPEAPARPASFPGIYGKIEVIVGSQQVGTYLVTDNQLTIGRDPAQALAIIQEPIVSKLHCSIFFRDGHIVIKDLNSTNGTYMNDEKISERELFDGDVVSLGKKGTIKIIYHK